LPSNEGAGDRPDIKAARLHAAAAAFIEGTEEAEASRLKQGLKLDRSVRFNRGVKEELS
jgi:hypothetical protein